MIRRDRVLASRMLVLVMLVAVVCLSPMPAFGQGAGAEVKEHPVSPRVDVFGLDLGETRALSRSKNFEVVGHSYFKGPWLTPFAQQNGLGASFNTPRVYDGIGYFGGYNSPAILFGALIADVSDPRNMRPLSFIPCNPGTRCPYIRVNNRRKILVGTHDTNAGNPNKPPAGQPAVAGISFHDVSNPSSPQPLGFLQTALNGATHGFEIDDRYVYACASTPQTRPSVSFYQELVIVDYLDPRNPSVVGRYHIQGQHVDETFDPMNRNNPDGSPQLVWCHEVNLHKNRLYIAWRDAGLVVLDVSDPTSPTRLANLDYVPPFNGGGLGAAHTSAPVIADPNEHPKLVVHTDEIFNCAAVAPGFGRIIDISTLSNPQVISNYRIPTVSDQFDDATGLFTCPAGQQSIHQPWFDFRSPSLFYQPWYDQGLRVWDISNPFLPREVGYYVSPKYASAGRVDRHTREAFQDRDTGLIYMTDGNGGGVTVLRWIGPIPPKPPIPGAR